MKKEEFNLDNFNFKIVKMNVFNNAQTIDMDYYLLVDDSNFIHDYKIHFKKIEVRNITTASHEIKKAHNTSLINRIYLLEQLGLKHIFQDKDKHNTRKEIYFFNMDHIEKTELNKDKCLIDFRNMTFQNINYMLSGSNPSGEGKGSGTLYTNYKGNKINFGFFLQCLNITKDINMKFTNINYHDVWFRENIERITFEEWLNRNIEIRNLFIEFKISSIEWKKIKKSFENEYKTKRMNFINLEKEISILRREQKKRAEKHYDFTSINLLQKKYFDIDVIDDKVVYAHIKPVWKIKFEYINNGKDKSILEQISDINNFLPLPPDIHDMYDNYMFYWNTNGQIINVKSTNTKRLNQYQIYNKEILSNIAFYLKEYIKIIKERNNKINNVK